MILVHFIELFSNHHSLMFEHFHRSKNKPISQHQAFHSQPQATTKVLSVGNIPYEENHSMQPSVFGSFH